MIFYVILTFLMGGLVACRIKSRGVAFFLLIFLFILTAFRGEYVGHDTETYLSTRYQYIRAYNYPNFYNLSDFKFSDLGSAIELFSNSIYRIIFEYDLSPRFILFFFAFISLLFYWLALKSFKANIVYGLAFYVILGYMSQSFNLSRQICAACILLYAYSFLIADGVRKYYFFLFVVFAALIHSFSIVFLLVYPLSRVKNINKKWERIILVMCICFPLIKLDFLNTISLLLSIDHISGYLDDFGGQGILLTKLISSYIYIFISFYFYYKSKEGCMRNDQILRNLFLFSILLSSMLVSYSGVIGRVSLDFSIIECAFISLYFYRNTLRANSIDSWIFIMMLVYRSYLNFRMIDPGAPQFYLSF